MGHVVMCIADTTRARFYIQDTRGAPFALVGELAHPEGGMRNIDLVSDRPGTTRSGFNRSIAERTPPKEIEHTKLAREIAAYLDKMRARGQLGELVLVMGPRMMGLVKGEMSGLLAKCIVEQLEGDVAHLGEQEIASFLRGKWPVAARVFANQPEPLRMTASMR